jgi:hypothetical protein
MDHSLSARRTGPSSALPPCLMLSDRSLKSAASPDRFPEPGQLWMCQEHTAMPQLLVEDESAAPSPDDMADFMQGGDVAPLRFDRLDAYCAIPF